MSWRQSAVREWLGGCKRRTKLAYMEDLVPKYDEAIPSPTNSMIGTLFHARADVYYGGDTPRWPFQFENPLASPLDHDPALVAEWAKANDTVNSMIAQYDEAVTGEGWDFGRRTLATEARLEGWGVNGKADLVQLDLATERLIVVDFKSVDRLDNGPATNDFQLLTYGVLVEQHFEIPVGTIEHRQVRRIIPSARSKGPYVGQHKITPSRRSLERHIGVLELASEAMDRASLLDIEDVELPATPDRNCSWRCEFRDVCPMVDDGDDWQAYLLDHFTERSDETESEEAP